MTQVALDELLGVERDGSRLRLSYAPQRLPTPAATDVHGRDATDRATSRESVPVDVEWLSADAVRLQLRPDPETTPADWSALDCPYDAIREPVTPVVSNADGRTTADTEGLCVAVDHDTGQITVRDRATDRRLLTTRQTVTDTRGESVVPPTGYTEQRTTGWPLSVTHSSLALRLPPDEAVYGCGEFFGDENRRGSRLTARVRQATGTAGRDTYLPVPFYLSDRGYGVFVDTTADTTFDFGASAPGVVSVEAATDALSVVVFRGPEPADVVRQYTALTGRPPELPSWTLGVWWSRNSYDSAEQVNRVTSRLREEEIGGDVVNLDPEWMDLSAFDLRPDEAFGEFEAFLSGLRERSFRVSLWEYPHLPVRSPLFEAARDRGGLLEDGSGRPLLVRRPSSPDTRAGTLDVTNPAAVEWWQSHHRRLLDAGVAAFKTDFGEAVPDEAVCSDGRSGRAIHNEYPVAYQRAVAGSFDDTPVLFSRAGWAGAQRYPIHWGGDAEPTDAGFAASVRGGLGLAASGFGLWSCDIGGYAGEPTPDCYRRWAQWGLLALSSPRFHGRTAREPWEFDATDVVRRYTQLRYRLLPYYHTLAVTASRVGLPVLRPVVLERPDDPTAGRGLEHFVGPSLLVAPDTQPGEVLEIRLPEGEWIDWWTGSRHHGPTTVEREPPRSELPMFWAAGSLVPEGPGGESVEAAGVRPTTLRLFAHRSGDTHATFDWPEPRSDGAVPGGDAATDDTAGETTDTAPDDTTGETSSTAPDDTSGDASNDTTDTATDDLPDTASEDTPTRIAGDTPTRTAGDTAEAGDTPSGEPPASRDHRFAASVADGRVTLSVPTDWETTITFVVVRPFDDEPTVEVSGGVATGVEREQDRLRVTVADR